MKDTTVSIDTAGCQSSLAQVIVEKKGNDVLTLKKNQPKTYQAVTDDIKDQSTLNHIMQDGFDDTHDQSIRRCYFVYDIQVPFSVGKTWSELKTVLAVESIYSTK